MNFIRVGDRLLNLDNVAVIVPDGENRVKAYLSGGSFNFVYLDCSLGDVCHNIATKLEVWNRGS